MAENIERFEEIAKKLLVALYESFPSPAYIGPNDAGLTEEQPGYGDSGRWEASDEWRKLDKEVRDVMLWLVEEGFVHDRQYKMAGSHILTTQGFIALKKLDSKYNPPSVVKTISQ